MNREALADRVITYSDALAAFSLVNALAFVITLAEPDIRCSIVNIAGPVACINITVAGLITAGLVMLRRFERSLRDEDDQEPRIERFWRYAHIVRIALVWSVVLLVTLGLWTATQDAACISPAT